jgi:hypothetical protein
MYPEPMKMMTPEAAMRPMDMAVPSSRSWYPTTPLSRRIQVVDTTAAMWMAVNPCRENSFVRECVTRI